MQTAEDIKVTLPSEAELARGFKEKYYREKFHIKASEFLQLKHHISNTYL